MKNLIRTLVIVAGGIWFAGCQQGRDAYAVTTTDTLIRFDTAKPNNISAEMPITGLAAGETLRQIDFRPANKVLYGITSANRLVTVNTTTGATTAVGAGPFTTNPLAAAVMDFNPVGDYLRVINFVSGGANNSIFRVNADTGVIIQTDGNGTLTFATNDAHQGEVPQLAAIAHSNNKSDATSTTLYGLDITTQGLVSITVGGVLTTIHTTSRGFTANAGFDIVPNNDKAYVAIADRTGVARFYNFSLTDGSVTSGNDIGSNRQVRSIAVTLDEPKRSGFNF